VINYQFPEKWYNVHFPMFEQILIGNFMDVAINFGLVFYYFGVLRPSLPKG